jgi:hypothetical protein
MKDKFSYYDFLANIIPGLLLAWILSSTFQGFLFGNIVTGTFIFLVLAYILGLAIQFFSKYTIEWLIKVFFWSSSLYSSIILIKEAKIISDEKRSRLLGLVKNKFHYNDTDLKVLDTENIFQGQNKNKLKQAKEVSHEIYRKLDSYTFDKGLAQKSHIQNIYYSLFRGLSLAFLIIGLLFTALAIFSQQYQTTRNIIYLAVSYILFIVFLIRTKERGELYVKGLFESLR